MRCPPIDYDDARSWHGPCNPVGWNRYEEDTVRTTARTIMTLMAALAFTGGSASAQHVSFSLGTGSLFDGVGFGLHVGSYSPGSAFVGLSLGLGWRSHGYGSPYGIYSDGYYDDDYYDDDYYDDGYYDHYSCGDYYHDSFWDPWYNDYYDCYRRAYRPYYGFYYGPFYNSYYPSRWGWYGSRFSYWRDPWSYGWGRSWVYDPWGGYWNGYWDGYYVGGSRYWGYSPYYYGGHSRTVYAYGGRRGTAIYRPSPFSRLGPSYKESPRGTVASTARRRMSGLLDRRY